MLTTQELMNILVLLKKTPITGEEAMTVAVLMQKIQNLIKPIEKVPATAQIQKKPIKDKN